MQAVLSQPDTVFRGTITYYTAFFRIKSSRTLKSQNDFLRQWNLRRSI